MLTALDALNALDRRAFESIDAAHASDPTLARRLFVEIRNRAFVRELEDRLAQFHPGVRGSVRVAPLAHALRILSGASQIAFPEAEPVRDDEVPPADPDRAFFGPFELQAMGAGQISLGIPPSSCPLSIFRDGSPYALIEGRNSETILLGPGFYRLRLGDEEWEISVES